MDSEQLLAEIREANLTYLMLAQNLIRKDRAEALYRLGLTEEAADLLRKNAVEERGHARRIARALSIKTGTEWSPTAEQEILLDAPMPDSIDAPLFLAVVKGEIDGDAGYQKWADLETNEDIARLLRLNGREETVHAGRAQQVYEILSR